MQYEDIIYRAGILAMAARLEAFLKELVNGVKKDTLGTLIDKFGKRYNAPELLKMMRHINEERNKAAHNPDYRNYESFENFRRTCIKVDKKMEREVKSRTGMRDIMISCSLRYDMGNAGDIIKHGVLAEFTEWWFERNDTMRYADPFGGRPWGFAKREAANRAQKLSKFGCALGRAQQFGNLEFAKYYGSSHVVLNASQRNASKRCARVFASDRDKLARADLKASSLKLIEEEIPAYQNGEGYAILDHADKFDFILLDPYADLLSHDFVHNPTEKRFDKILRQIQKQPNLWIAVFVLDAKKGESSDVSKKYQKYMQNNLANCAVRLRCDKIKQKGLEGESSYDMEIVLISSRLADKNDDEITSLLKRIEQFKDAAVDAIGDKKPAQIEFYPPISPPKCA